VNPHHFGSYSPNGYLLTSEFRRLWPNHYFPDDGFRNEEEIVQPGVTPVLGDAIHEIAWPIASESPPSDLSESGAQITSGMLVFTTPRHGSRPNPIPTEWPASVALPGAINISFVDGHGELVKLDRLWQLHWGPNYQPPAKRPGLP
jgi:prepilin-type processing-associated H-X9-DG protein